MSENRKLELLELIALASGVNVGSVTETAPADDTASSGLNGRLQRIAQRLTTIIAAFGVQFPASLWPSGLFKVALGDSSGNELDYAIANASSRILSAAASTNATSAKAAPGTLFRVSGFNARASAVYLKFYDKASAPTVGTDTPVITEYLAASSRFEVNWPTGRAFAVGIAYAMTTAGADADTGALTAADILALNVGYA